jgi:hypothetical protein
VIEPGVRMVLLLLAVLLAVLGAVPRVASPVALGWLAVACLAAAFLFP